MDATQARRGPRRISSSRSYRERDGAALFKTRHDGGGLLAFNAAFLISGRRYWRACPSGDLPNRWRDPRRFETIPFKVVLISRRQE